MGRGSCVYVADDDESRHWFSSRTIPAGGFNSSTDTITPIDPTDLTADMISTAEDNRQIGWLGAGYQRRESAVSDFLANSGNSPNPAAFTIDPEHIIAKGVWLNMFTTSDSTTSPTRDWSYMVVLRPKKLDPKETILHLIKNVAQDITN